MKILPQLFDNNRKWAAEITRSNPTFFQDLARQQSPEFLWIGCSDSRVPANEVVGLRPGELFVHRNIANLVIHTDMNCLSVVHYAVDVLQIRHIMVCGHYGCGGVKAAMENRSHGLVDNWIRHIRDTYRHNAAELDGIADETSRINRLCELNVIEQVENVGNMTAVRDAWEKGRLLTIHGWIYDISDGLLKDLDVSLSSLRDLKTLGRR